MNRPPPETAGRPHLVGFALAALLTVIPFAAVGLRLFARDTTLALIAFAAIVQIAVHLRFFLDLRVRESRPGRWISLLFAAVLIVIMGGGTLWIMASLAWRMGHS